MSWAQVAPRYMTANGCPATKPARNLPSKNRSSKTFCHLIIPAAVTAQATTTGCCLKPAYLPDLILVQLRVRIRWVAAGKSEIAYSLASTSAGG
jgi:hypothetical protein